MGQSLRVYEGKKRESKEGSGKLHTKLCSAIITHMTTSTYHLVLSPWYLQLREIEDFTLAVYFTVMLHPVCDNFELLRETQHCYISMYIYMYMTLSLPYSKYQTLIKHIVGFLKYKHIPNELVE